MISPYLGTAVIFESHWSAWRRIVPPGFPAGIPTGSWPPARPPLVVTTHVPAAALSLVSCGTWAAASAGEEPVTVVFGGRAATGIGISIFWPQMPNVGLGAAMPAGGWTCTWMLNCALGTLLAGSVHWMTTLIDVTLRVVTLSVAV